MASHETPDPKKALDAYKYPQQPDDDKIISEVETQIKIHFPVSYTAGLVEKAADAPIKKSEVEEQKKKYEDRVAQAKKDHPDEIKKEGLISLGSLLSVSSNTPQKPARTCTSCEGA